MIKINLLPTKTPLKIPSVFFYGTIILAVVIVAFIISTLFLAGKVSQMRTEIAAKEKKLVDLKKAIEEVKNYEKANQEVRDKTAIIEQLKKNQSIPLKLLDEVSEMLPKGVWLTTLSEKSGVVSIDGFADTNYNLVAYVQNLKASKTFADVMLIESRQTMIDTFSVYKFKLTFKIKA